MMLDDVINSSFKCLKAIRDAERQWKDYPETALTRLEEAQAYLDILRKESPLMYNILNPEYGKVLKMYKKDLIIK